jgi:tetratricopeptide (TPR) repeat protein
MAQKHYQEAVSLLRLRYEKAPHPENLYELAETLVRAGETEEAEALFARLEREARAPVLLRRPRVPPSESAPVIAEREIAWRRDVFTRDAFAWALHRSGKSTTARSEIEAALAVGIKDARMLYHAGAISSASGDREEATRYFRESLALNPFSSVAAQAREALRTLDPEVAP